MNPRWPIYIVSKGRAGAQLTSRHLHEMGVPHTVVVEAAEAEAYRAQAAPSATIIVLDPRYQAEYETCDDLGTTKGPGPGPARNFAWDHALAAGAAWHWVMDDNIDGFFRIYRNRFYRAGDGTILRCMEDFADRYRNVAMAGPQYFMFVARKSKAPPFVTNTRIYSCNLIRNDVPYRWRGRYNEDTDLSLRMLKDGWCTVQYNAFLQYKVPTQSMRGGNTDEFYAREGTLPKSQMLAQLHPDVARVAWRFGRWHHYVDYSPFKATPLRRRPGVTIEPGRNDYGMTAQRLREGQWIPLEAPETSNT